LDLPGRDPMGLETLTLFLIGENKYLGSRRQRGDLTVVETFKGAGNPKRGFSRFKKFNCHFLNLEKP